MGWGRAGFPPRDPAATRAGGAFFRANPTPPCPGRVPAHTLDWARFLTPKTTGACLGNGRSQRRGKGNFKKQARPGLFSGTGWGTGPGGRCFWGPGGPVTNAKTAGVKTLTIVNMLRGN